MERKLYTYILTHDNGKSPCYTAGEFSLACCKPQIRRSILKDYKEKIETNQAKVYVAGIKRDKKDKKPFIVYLAKITKVLTLQEYYDGNGEYIHRDDCHYRNVHTIYNESGKLPFSLQSTEIRRECPKLCADDKNEHGKITKRQTLTEYQCRDIHGAAVLLSDSFIHCSCCDQQNPANDILTNAFHGALDSVLNGYKEKNQRIWHSFNGWKEFDDVIGDIPLGKHTDVIPLDKGEWWDGWTKRSQRASAKTERKVNKNG